MPSGIGVQELNSNLRLNMCLGVIVFNLWQEIAHLTLETTQSSRHLIYKKTSSEKDSVTCSQSIIRSHCEFRLSHAKSVLVFTVLMDLHAGCRVESSAEPFMNTTAWVPFLIILISWSWVGPRNREFMKAPPGNLMCIESQDHYTIWYCSSS